MQEVQNQKKNFHKFLVNGEMSGVQIELEANRNELPEPFKQISAYNGNEKTKRNRSHSQPQMSCFQRGENCQAQDRSRNFVQMNSDAGRDYANRDYANRNFQNSSRSVQQNVIENPTPHDTSIRSRQSTIHMPLSQQFVRNDQIANVEDKNADEIGNANENDFEDSGTNEINDSKFHFTGDTLSTG